MGEWARHGEISVAKLRLLTIGGSDPTAGAGIQADLKTFMAHGAFGLSVVTALIAGNTTELRSLHALPAPFVADQLDALVSDIGADAAKTGLLGGAAVIEAVGEQLRAAPAMPLVIDPVLVAKSGTRILDDAAREATIRWLLPLATVATPNIREAAALAGRPVASVAEMEDAARAISDLGPRAVIVKGRGLTTTGGEVIDVLYSGNQMIRLTVPRVVTSNIRGTGCTLSAALTVQLARGRSVAEALPLARGWVIDLLRASTNLRLGHGVGPLDHTAVPAPD